MIGVFQLVVGLRGFLELSGIFQGIWGIFGGISPGLLDGPARPSETLDSGPSRP